MIFRQLFEHESSTYTYLIACAQTRKALIIDPVLETFERDCKLIEELQLELVYSLETHVHADHITAAAMLKQRFKQAIVLGSKNKVENADLLLGHQAILEVGEIKIDVIHTPGHTNGCVSYLIGDKLFTGDALLIRSCGRTDFQEGSSEKLFRSVREKLFSYGDHFTVYPAHDYNGHLCSTIGEEKELNKRLNLTISKEEFIEIMANLNLEKPKKIDISLEANMRCGFKAT